MLKNTIQDQISEKGSRLDQVIILCDSENLEKDNDET